jgi:putative transposase
MDASQLAARFFTHEAVQEWEAKLAPVLSETLRKHRRGKVGRSWYCDKSAPRTHRFMREDYPPLQKHFREIPWGVARFS